jgi:hypothetical protein
LSCTPLLVGYDSDFRAPRGDRRWRGRACAGFRRSHS